MDLGNAGNFFAVLEEMLELAEQDPKKSRSNNSNNNNHRSWAYVRDAKAMAATPAYVVEYPNAYVFVVDMQGIKAGEIKVHVEANDNILVLSGERRREKENEESGVKYVRMERRVGKLMRKFVLPKNANLDVILAVAKDGVLTVRVGKLPPPKLKRPKTIHVIVA